MRYLILFLLLLSTVIYGQRKVRGIDFTDSAKDSIEEWSRSSGFARDSTELVVSDTVTVLRSDMSDSLSYNVRKVVGVDAYASIQAAITAADAGDVIWLTPGSTYIITDTLEITKSLTLASDPSNPATISNSTTMSVYAYGALAGDSTTLADTIITGMEFMRVADSSIFSTGDLFYMCSDSLWYNNPASTSPKSELHKVGRVTGDSVYIEGGFFDSYDSGIETVNIYTITPITVNLENLNFLCEDTLINHIVLIDKTSDSEIINCEFKGGWNENIKVFASYNPTIRNSRFRTANKGGLGYNIKNSSNTYMNIKDNFFYEARRHIDITSGTKSPINNSTQISGNTFLGGGWYNPVSEGLLSANQNAITAHWGAQGALITDNQVVGHYAFVQTRGSGFTVSGNKATGDMLYFFITNTGNNHVVTDNTYDSRMADRYDLSSDDGDYETFGLKDFARIGSGSFDDPLSFLDISNNTVIGLYGDFIDCDYDSIQNFTASFNRILFDDQSNTTHYFLGAGSACKIVDGSFLNNTFNMNGGTFDFDHADISYGNYFASYYDENLNQFYMKTNGAIVMPLATSVISSPLFGSQYFIGSEVNDADTLMIYGNGRWKYFISDEGLPDSVMNFDGTNDYIALADTTYYTGDMTIAWRFLIDDPTNVPHFFGHGGSGTNYIRYNPTDNFEIESNLNGDIVTFNQTVLDDGAWHDAIITFDSTGIDTTTCTLYIDGSLVSADSLFEDSLAISYMGAVAAPTRQLDGSMWDIGIYSSILTATQIADYSAFKAIPTTNLIHKWVGSGDSCIVDNGWLDTVGSSEGTVSGSPTKRSYK